MRFFLVGIEAPKLEATHTAKALQRKVRQEKSTPLVNFYIFNYVTYFNSLLVFCNRLINSNLTM